MRKLPCWTTISTRNRTASPSRASKFFVPSNDQIHPYEHETLFLRACALYHIVRIGPDQAFCHAKCGWNRHRAWLLGQRSGGFPATGHPGRGRQRGYHLGGDGGIYTNNLSRREIG